MAEALYRRDPHSFHGRREMPPIGAHLKTWGHLPRKGLDDAKGSGWRAFLSFERRPSNWSTMAASRLRKEYAIAVPQPRRWNHPANASRP